MVIIIVIAMNCIEMKGQDWDALYIHYKLFFDCACVKESRDIRDGAPAGAGRTTSRACNIC